MKAATRLFAAGIATTLVMAAAATASAATTSGTFTAAGPNNVPATGGSGIAQTYPWKLSVSGMSGNTSNVDVTLWGVVNSRVPDIDALLVGPNGAGNSLFMSDIGDATPITAPGVNLTFDDGASANAPVGGALASGTYRPTNGNGVDGDAFPSPSPSGSYASNLAALNGHSPNGTWNLYLNDDDGTGVDTGTGSVQSWSLSLSTVVSTKTTKKKKVKKKKSSTSHRRSCRRRHGRSRLRCKCRRRARFAASHRRKCRRVFRHRRR